MFKVTCIRISLASTLVLLLRNQLGHFERDRAFGKAVRIDPREWYSSLQSDRQRKKDRERKLETEKDNTRAETENSVRRERSLVSTRARRVLAFALQTQQDLLEPRQVLLRLCRRLGAAVGQVDQLTDPFPRRALRQRFRQVRLELFFVLPVDRRKRTARIGSVRGRENNKIRIELREETHLFWAIDFSFFWL